MTSPLTSTEWAGFVHAIRFTPDDNTPRLVAADWLQETGLPELEAWAEFIRLQIAAQHEIATRLHVYGDSCDCGGCRPERRAAMLCDRWGTHWSYHQFNHVGQDLKPTSKLKSGTAKEYERGFLGSVTFTITEWKSVEVPRDISPLYDRCPLPVLMICLRSTTPFRRFFDSWDIRVSQRVHRPKWMNVVAEIMPFPLVGGQRSTRTTRIVDRKNNFGRHVRGAVRQAISERREYLDLTAVQREQDLIARGVIP